MAINSYLKKFENLTSNSVDELLEEVHENIFFEDPFNKINSKKELKSLLLLMFKKFKSPKFKIIYKYKNKGKYVIKWECNYEIFKKKVSFTGMSEIITKEGLVISHIDFWDSGRNFYYHLPILGALFRKIHRND